MGTELAARVVLRVELAHDAADYGLLVEGEFLPGQRASARGIKNVQGAVKRGRVRNGFGWNQRGEAWAFAGQRVRSGVRR